MTNRILIYVQGGVIQNIVSDQHVDIFVADYDVDGLDEDAISFLDGECTIDKYEHGTNRVAINIAEGIVSERGGDK